MGFLYRSPRSNYPPRSDRANIDSGWDLPPRTKNPSRKMKVGADADITVFDPESILDQATYVDPIRPSAGIKYVLVNGGVVLDGGVLDPTIRNGAAVRSN